MEEGKEQWNKLLMPTNGKQFRFTIKRKRRRYDAK